MPLITGIHHVSMMCTADEYAKVKAFYGEVLELPIAREWSDGIMFDAGSGNIIEIFPSAADHPGQGEIRHFALGTGDVDACVRAVEAAGYKVFTAPKDVTIPSAVPMNARIAFCYGPCGEEIEFFDSNPDA